MKPANWLLCSKSRPLDPVLSQMSYRSHPQFLVLWIHLYIIHTSAHRFLEICRAFRVWNHIESLFIRIFLIVCTESRLYGGSLTQVGGHINMWRAHFCYGRDGRWFRVSRLSDVSGVPVIIPSMWWPGFLCTLCHPPPPSPQPHIAVTHEIPIRFSVVLGPLPENYIFYWTNVCIVFSINKNTNIPLCTALCSWVRLVK